MKNTLLMNSSFVPSASAHFRKSLNAFAPVLLSMAIGGSVMGIIAGAGVVHAAEREDQLIARKGFTLALTIGPGGASLFPSSGGATTEPGVGAGIALGAFLTPRLALLGRMSGVGYFGKSNIDAAGVGVVGPALEWWLSDHVSVLTGIGLGFTNVKPATGDHIAKSGFGVMLGGHWFPWVQTHHGLGFYAEVQPVFLAQGGGQAFTFQGGFAWQYY